MQAISQIGLKSPSKKGLVLFEGFKNILFIDGSDFFLHFFKELKFIL